VFMAKSHLRLDIALIIGALAIGLGLMETCSGEALEGYGRTASRGEEPQRFWKAIAIHYLCGVVGIAYFLFEMYMSR
jgi:hypothetical protein